MAKAEVKVLVDQPVVVGTQHRLLLSGKKAVMDGVYVEMMQVSHGDLQCASDSDVIDDEDPSRTWVQTLENKDGVAYKARGRKRCVICKDTSGLMRRCNRCRHHVHGLRASPCQHFKCNGWWCNKHCHRILMTDGRPVAV
eukprot:2493602-Amphidinium_carterae.1